MKYSPDQYILWEKGFIQINSTLVYTWILMTLLIGLGVYLRIKLAKKGEASNLQNLLEAVLEYIEKQVKKLNGHNIQIVFPFISTLFLFILISNLFTLVPGFMSPTASLSTTIGLTLTVFIIDVIHSVKEKGVLGYLKKYTKPSPVVLPLNIVNRISSHFSLAIRLYGNIMSSFVISLILLRIVFLNWGFPVFLQLITLITSIVQAYIFSILAMIFISSK